MSVFWFLTFLYAFKHDENDAFKHAERSLSYLSASSLRLAVILNNFLATYDEFDLWWQSARAEFMSLSYWVNLRTNGSWNPNKCVFIIYWFPTSSRSLIVPIQTLFWFHTIREFQKTIIFFYYVIWSETFWEQNPNFIKFPH